MKMESVRIKIVEYGKKMIDTGLVKGSGGNISCFDPKEGLMAISPGSMDYHDISPEDVMLMDLDGKIVDGRKEPSSEWQMHMIFYKNRSDARAVVHTHSAAAAALSCLGMELPPIYYLTMMAGESVRCAPYARYGTSEIANGAFKAMNDRYACLLANHGVITCSYNLSRAYSIAEQVEYAADLYLKCRSVREPNSIPPEGVKEMIDVFEQAKYQAMGDK